MLITKRKHRKIVAIYKEERDVAREEQQRMKDLYTMADREARLWRERFELSQFTPEVKADTEGAFKRGEQSARRKLANALMTYASQLTQGDSDEAN